VNTHCRTSVRTPRRAAAARPAFSIVEMLIALAITSALLTASLAALDASFKSYKVTSDSASTHVVARIVNQRVMALLRTGSEFGPYPEDVLDPDQNPIVSTFIEFESFEDADAGLRQITRLERRDDSEDREGLYELWYVRMDFVDGTLAETVERPLIRNLTEVSFTLEYDIGPRLRRATVDLTIQPDDLQDAAIAADLEAPTIRLVSSTSARQLE